MANPGYVRSTDGNDGDNGSTWALANATLAGAMADQAAGDTIYISQAHAESSGTTQAISCPGTLAAPCKLICGNDAAEPPTALATTGAITTTTSASITIAGSLYAYGITFTAGSGNNNAGITLGNGATTAAEVQVYEKCTFIIGSTATSAQNINCGKNDATSGKHVVWDDCDLKFSGTGGRIVVYSNFDWNGGAIVSGTTTPTLNGIFTLGASTKSGVAKITGVDFSNFASTVNFVNLGSYLGEITFSNCKLPEGWSGGLFNGTPTQPGFRARMHNCDSGDTNYRLWEEDWLGSCKTSTTVTRTGGASDGTTAYSWVIATNANAEYPGQVFASPDLPAIWNATTGSAVTVSVEIALDNSGTALTDAEAWLEVEFLGTSGFPLATISTDAKADVLASAANQTTSSVTWSGLTTPTKQTLSVSVTPQEAGYIQGRVRIAKASTTVYVDPKMTVA